MSNPDLSILDANLARAREGLRVLEDIARFEFRDAATASSLKNIRHSLRGLETAFGGSALLFGRQRGEEAPSKILTTEQTRSNLLGIIRANANRTTEALRTLEEFSKIYIPNFTQSISAARYALYQLELTLARSTPHFWLDWYNVAGFIYPINDSPNNLIRYIRGGARVVQLRDKNSPLNDFLNNAAELTAFAGEWNRAHQDEKVLVIINDSLDIAARLPVAGVHLGQTDGGVMTARRLLGANKIIGRSNNTISQLEQSIAAGADYVSFGPVFATPSKPDRAPTGLANLETAVAVSKVPLVAIGGIDKSGLEAIYASGAKNAAVIRSAEQFFG